MSASSFPSATTMNEDNPQQDHLSDDSRSIIRFQLHQGMTPQDIVDQWDEQYHNRPAPHVRTIYKEKKQFEERNSSLSLKSGPKSKRVLTPSKLDEIENVLDEDPFATDDAVASRTKISKSSVQNGVKIIEKKTFYARQYTKLNEAQIHLRMEFCQTYLKWNNQYRMMIWWSDECIFRLSDLFKHENRKYRANENLHLGKEKVSRKLPVNVWCAIRGDGKLLYFILEGRHNSETYIQLLFNFIDRMDPKHSFLMQDGAGLHISDDALDWLDFLWGDRWIGLKSKRLQFPSKSMDLTPMDFAFWTYVKKLVLEYDPKTTIEMRDAIEAVLNNVDDEAIRRMCQGVAERCSKCLRYNGERFEGKP